MIAIIVILFLLIVLAFVQIISHQNKITSIEESKNLFPILPMIPQHTRRLNDNLHVKPLPQYTFSNDPRETLYNPYAPPVKHYEQRHSYSQVGFLKGGGNPIPLFGKQCTRNRNNWNYYTITENNLKLPILHKKKSCTSEYGCDELYNNDSVYVDGVNGVYNVSIYENNMFE